MEEYEISIILGSLGEGFKMEWEMTRFLSYSIFQSQSTKKIKPTDIITFSWEEKPENIEVSKEDYNRLVNKAKSRLTNKAKK